MAAARVIGKYNSTHMPSWHLSLVFAHVMMLTIIRGNFGEEIVDENFRFTNARRRSNSSSISHHVGDLKSKFDFNEPEPVFEESLHGPIHEDGEDLAKTDSSDSGRSSSV